MKLKYSILAICLFGTAFAAPSSAAVDPHIRLVPEQTGCNLSPNQSATLKVSWDKLARRFYYASMEAMEDPDHFLVVRDEVQAEVRKLRLEFGRHCVKSIGLSTRRFLLSSDEAKKPAQ